MTKPFTKEQFDTLMLFISQRDPETYKKLEKLLVESNDGWTDHDGSRTSPCKGGIWVEIENKYNGTIFKYKNVDIAWDTVKRYRIIEDKKPFFGIDLAYDSGTKLYNPKTHYLVPKVWTGTQMSNFKIHLMCRLNPLNAIEKVFGGKDNA